MRFETLPPHQRRTYKVIYRQRDYALDSVPKPMGLDFTSLSFNDLQLELSEFGIGEYVWGCCPKQSWQVCQLEPPPAIPGELRVLPDSPLIPGVSLRASTVRLPVYYNEITRWLCLGDPAVRLKEGFSVQIAPGVIVVGDINHVAALWVLVSCFE